MLVPVLNAIYVFFFKFFMPIASNVCNHFLLLFLYIIIVLSMKIFLTLEDINWLDLIIKCCFMPLFSER